MAYIYDNKYKNMTSAYRGYAAFTQVTKASHVITDHTLLFGWLLLLFGTVFVQNVLVIPRDDVIKWKHFPRYWTFVREFTCHRWIPRTKASDVEF